MKKASHKPRNAFYAQSGGVTAVINADEKLKPVFGGKAQVSMFEMTKLVNKHLK